MGLSNFTIGYMPSTIALMTRSWLVLLILTDSGLSHPRPGNLEILCEPGPPFVPVVFEAALHRESREVSDDEFAIWQHVAQLLNAGSNHQLQMIMDSGLEDWKPQTRNPSYLWLYYSGNEAQIVSDEQRTLAGLDVRTLGVPTGLTLELFRDWIHLSLQASPFMDLARRFEGRSDAVVWDSVAEAYGVSRSIAARWLSTAYNWLKHFDPGDTWALGRPMAPNDAGEQ